MIMNNACFYSPMASNVSSFGQDGCDASKEHLELIASTSAYDPSNKVNNIKLNNANIFAWSLNKQQLNKNELENNSGAIDGSTSFCDHYHTQLFGNAGFNACGNGISRQQRNNNICQWLQKLNLNTENNSRTEYNNSSFNNLAASASRPVAQSNMSMEVEMSPQ